MVTHPTAVEVQDDKQHDQDESDDPEDFHLTGGASLGRVVAAGVPLGRQVGQRGLLVSGMYRYISAGGEVATRTAVISRTTTPIATSTVATLRRRWVPSAFPRDGFTRSQL